MMMYEVGGYVVELDGDALRMMNEQIARAEAAEAEAARLRDEVEHWRINCETLLAIKTALQAPVE